MTQLLFHNKETLTFFSHCVHLTWAMSSVAACWFLQGLRIFGAGHQLYLGLVLSLAGCDIAPISMPLLTDTQDLVWCNLTWRLGAGHHHDPWSSGSFISHHLCISTHIGDRWWFSQSLGDAWCWSSDHLALWCHFLAVSCYMFVSLIFCLWP